MSYRADSCTFCDEPGKASCPRCAAWVCSTHDLGDQGYCGICAKELKDDLEEQQFKRTVSHSPDYNSVVSPKGEHSHTPLGSVHRAADAVAGWFGHGVQQVFAGRSAEQIAAWRRRAGIFVRGG